MSEPLSVLVGQWSDRGQKKVNQDFHGAYIPTGAVLGTKGISLVLADGISSSEVSQVASELAVRGFLDDYYCTSEAWSVKRSAQRVLAVTNSWLYSQNRRSEYRFDQDRGYVCTLSALVLKGAFAHLFHVGDTRIYRLQGQALEQLTEDHRVWVSAEQSYLGRALGVSPQLEIDYRAVAMEQGDIFVLASDGVYEHVDGRAIRTAIAQHPQDLDCAARLIVEQALAAGSADNLTIQIVQVLALPPRELDTVQAQRAELAMPPLLQARQEFEGYRIVRELYASNRSHIYLAVDEQSARRVVLKTPSVDLQQDTAHLDRFLLEEWIARRLDSAHVLKCCAPERKRAHLFVVMEFVEGQTLAQWMLDNPRPELETVRAIIEQLARGLQAFHRMEMLHQDLRPQNVMIDRTGTVKIIDFGSARVAGLAEADIGPRHGEVLGTLSYSAPEYFLGEGGSVRSDLFSLGVIAYQMLTGQLPYGTQVASVRTRQDQKRLRYRTALDERRAIPAWVDGVLEKAVHPLPEKRYEVLSEFVQDLRHPNPAFLHGRRAPLIEKNPLLFWKSLCALLAVLVLVLLACLRVGAAG